MRIKGRIHLSKIVNIMLLLLLTFIALGAYWETNSITIFVFLIAAIILFISNPKLVMGALFRHKSAIYWSVLIIVSFISTVLMRGSFALSTVYIELSIFFIVFTFTRYWEPVSFFCLFRYFILILSIISLFGYIAGIDFFLFLKAGTGYSSIDLKVGGGISTVFEYRHYYGVYLIVAFFIQVMMPFKKFANNFVAVMCFVLNILLTYTRNTWITLCLCGLIAVFHNYRGKIKKKYIYRFLIVLLVVVILSGLFIEIAVPMIRNVLKRMADAFDTTNSDFGGARGYSIIHGTLYILRRWLKYIWIGGGSGFAMSWLKANPYEWWTAAIDCQYVTTFMDVGLLGLIILIWILVYSIRNFGCIKSSIEKLICMSLFSIGVSMFFFEVIGTCTSVFILWNICLCGLSLEKQSVK